MSYSPWALASWAPFTFIGVEINKLPTTISRRNSNTSGAIELSDAGPPANTPTGELSGIYLGILNVYTTLPQFVASGISTIVFTLLEPGKSPELATDAHPDEHHSTDGYNGIAVCLFIGAFSSIAAAYATHRLNYAI